MWSKPVSGFVAGAVALVLALSPAAATSVTAASQTPTQGTTAMPADPTPPQAQASQPAAQGTNPEVSEATLARIRKGLAADVTLKLDDQQLRYYVQILAKQRTFSQFTKGFDWVNGATRGGNPMTHQEFVNMVTPKEMYSSAGIKPTEVLQFALTNWLGQALIKKALNDITNARDERELRAIRDRIDRELAALRGGR